MLSIVTSILLFDPWLLRIFVFSGWIFSPTLSVLFLKSHMILLSCSRDVENQHVVREPHVREAVSLQITQTDPHAFLAPSCQVVFQCSLQNRVEQQGTQRITLLCASLYLEHIGLFVCQDCRFLVCKRNLFKRLTYCGSLPNCASAVHNALCFIVSKAFAKSTAPKPSLIVWLSAVKPEVKKACCTRALNSICTTLVEYKSGGSYQLLPRHHFVFHFASYSSPFWCAFSLFLQFR